MPAPQAPEGKFLRVYMKNIDAASVTTKKVTCFQNVEKEGCPQGVGGWYFSFKSVGRFDSRVIRIRRKIRQEFDQRKMGNTGNSFGNRRKGERGEMDGNERNGEAQSTLDNKNLSIRENSASTHKPCKKWCMGGGTPADIVIYTCSAQRWK